MEELLEVSKETFQQGEVEQAQRNLALEQAEQRDAIGNAKLLMDTWADDRDSDEYIAARASLRALIATPRPVYAPPAAPPSPAAPTPAGPPTPASSTSPASTAE